MSEDNAKDNNVLSIFLNDKMSEREALLVRLGQLEDSLIKHGRLKKRTKPPRKSLPKNS
jgi:hypothetical protein